MGIEMSKHNWWHEIPWHCRADTSLNTALGNIVNLHDVVVFMKAV
jgi:hypothetical protein